MSATAGRTRFRGGHLPRRRFLALLALLSLAGPLLVFREAARDPLEKISCGRPAPNEKLGDPVIILSVMGRAWARWDEGDFSRHDDRVFAPYPDTWSLGEPWLLPSLVGYPWSRLAGSPALGYNVPYFLAAAVACFAAGLLLADLAGPGWPALVGALLFAWSPARLNNFGVMGTMWGGFVLLVLLFALRFLRSGRPRDAALASSALLVVGLGSLYPLVMGCAVVAIVGLATARSIRRAATLAAALAFPLAVLALVYAPQFRLAGEFDAPLGPALMEAQAADLLALLHTGLFAGPLREVLESILPGFPEGASACFPTLFVLGVFACAPLLLRRPRSSPPTGRPVRRLEPEGRAVRRTALSLWPWLAVSAVSFAAALGPTVRLAGRPLFPGPYRLVAGLPGLSGMRGLNRWDQWFCLGLVVAATLLLGRLLRSSRPGRGRVVLACLVPLVALDLWPRPVPSQPFPGPSPFESWLEALPRDAAVAVYPLRRAMSDRTWAEQLHHGRRVVNGYQTFPPPIHGWLYAALANGSFEETFAVFVELGVSAIEVDLDELPAGEVERIHGLLRDGALPRVRAAARSRSRLLVLVAPVVPILSRSRELSGLRFDGTSAVVVRAPDRLVFRLGSGRVDVVVESPSGSSRDTLLVPVVGAGELVASLSRPLPAGAIVRSVEDGREIGRAVSPAATRPPPSG